MEDVLFFLLVIWILQLTQKDSQRLPDAGLMQVRLTQQPVMPRVAQAVHNRFLFWHAAYSAITGILEEYNYFINASISPLLIVVAVMSEGDTAGKLQLHWGTTYICTWRDKCTWLRSGGGREIWYSHSKHTHRQTNDTICCYVCTHVPTH